MVPPQVSTAAEPAPKVFSLAAWNKKLSETYVRSSEESEDGVEEFSACFAPQIDSKKCRLFTFGRHDGFKKITTFQPGGSKIQQIVNLGNFVQSHLFVASCEMPGFVLRPKFVGDSWIFMESIAILADGVLVFEKQMSDVKRDTHVRGLVGVVETGGFVLTPSEIQTIRSMADAKNVVIRLSGQKGYVTLKKEHVKQVRDDLKTLVEIYDQLSTSLSEVSGSPCT